MTALRDPDELLKERLAQDEEEESDEDERGPVYSFSIDIKGTRGTWKGDFTYHVPTLGDTILIGEVHRGIQKTETPYGLANGYAHMIAYLTVTLKKKPDWFKPMDFHDPTPLVKAYEEVTAYEATFHGRDEDAREAPRKAADSEGSEADSDPVVGGDVQPSAERSEAIISHDS